MAPLIRSEAQRALELDPGEITLRFLLGAVAAGMDFDWDSASQHFRAAMASPAVPSEAHWAHASLFLNPLGRLEDAAAALRCAVEQDPLHGAWRSIFAHHLIEVGRYDEAMREIRVVLDIDENHWIGNTTLAYLHLVSGRPQEALPYAERAHRANPRHSFPAGVLAGTLARLGDLDRARDLILQIGDDPAPVLGRMMYHVLSGELEDAAAWYAKMIEQREPFALIFAFSPSTRPLRESSHWPRLARMMNLPEAS
jgi:tetratricopeptide (TPR) repeat protein